MSSEDHRVEAITASGTAAGIGAARVAVNDVLRQIEIEERRPVRDFGRMMMAKAAELMVVGRSAHEDEFKRLHRIFKEIGREPIALRLGTVEYLLERVSEGERIEIRCQGEQNEVTGEVAKWVIESALDRDMEFHYVGKRPGGTLCIELRKPQQQDQPALVRDVKAAPKPRP